jgi:hypothetical protein
VECVSSHFHHYVVFIIVVVQAIEQIVNRDTGTLTKLTPRELKTAIAISVDTNSELLLRSLVRKLHAAGVLTTELMSIALRLACRKRNPVMAATALRETKLLGYATDMDNINSVVEILAEHNDYLPIWDLVRDVQRGGYGEGVTCDAALYSHLLTSSSRQSSSQPLLDACRLIDAQRTSARVKTDEQAFMGALEACLLRSDLTGALRVRDLFAKLHGFVQTRVYAVILSIYLSRSKAGNVPTAVIDSERVAVLTMVQEMLNSKLDDNPVIADLLLRFHSLGCSLPSQDEGYKGPGIGITVDDGDAATTADAAAAAGSAYLQRLFDEYQILPGTLALTALTDAVVASKNSARIALLHQYYLRHRRVPPRSLTELNVLQSAQGVTENA